MNSPVFGTLDIPTGIFTVIGDTLVEPLIGLTAAPDGTWYACSGESLYTINPLNGNATLVGDFAPGFVFMVEIACNSQGELFALSTGTDSLFQIDPLTGVGTNVGPLGMSAGGFHMGMDFDWSTDTLYAVVLDSTGTASKFVSIDTATGVALTLSDPAPNVFQMEIAIQVPLQPTFSTFCDPMDDNSTGFPTVMLPTLPGGLHMEIRQGPPGEFGYLLVGDTPDFAGTPMDSGRLCLESMGGAMAGRYSFGGPTNSVGRFNAAGNMQNLVGTSTSGTGFDVPEVLP